MSKDDTNLVSAARARVDRMNRDPYLAAIPEKRLRSGDKGVAIQVYDNPKDYGRVFVRSGIYESGESGEHVGGKEQRPIESLLHDSPKLKANFAKVVREAIRAGLSSESNLSVESMEALTEFIESSKKWDLDVQENGSPD